MIDRQLKALVREAEDVHMRLDESVAKHGFAETEASFRRLQVILDKLSDKAAHLPKVEAAGSMPPPTILNALGPPPRD